MTHPEDRIVLNNMYEVVELISKQISAAEAWYYTARRLGDAHDYCNTHLDGSSIGKNVWHTILDDAIRMKKLYESGVA